MKSHFPRRFATAAVIVTTLLCFAMICGCVSPNTKSETAMGSVGASSASGIEELPAQGGFTPTNPENRVRVSVRVPEGYDCSEHLEDIEPYTGKKLELKCMLVDLGEKGSLQITVDDAGFFDWWYGGSAYDATTAYGYVESAMEDPSNSGWRTSIGGHEGVVLITGAAGKGGERSGDAFVFLDDATIALSAVLQDGGAPAADAYSAFFRSQDVSDLFDALSVSVQ